jgi:RHS repeat-associated protein
VTRVRLARRSTGASRRRTAPGGGDDQLLTLLSGGSTTTFAFDRNGNLRARTSGGSTTTYSYDVENRLTSITAGGSTTTFGYSAEGKRMKQVSGGTTMFFGVDYASLSGFDAVAEEYSSGGAITAKRVFGPWPDELLGVLTATASYVHRDALGSVTRITDSAGATSGSSRYLAFGGYREQSGSQDRYAFVSRESHLSGSLYYMRARHYDPTIGRFLSADPAGLRGGYNLFAYVGNNPVSRVDPTGRCAWWDLWCQIQCGTCVGLIGSICWLWRTGVAYWIICPMICSPFSASGVGYLICWAVCTAVLSIINYYTCYQTAGTVCRWIGKCY